MAVSKRFFEKSITLYKNIVAGIQCDEIFLNQVMLMTKQTIFRINSYYIGPSVTLTKLNRMAYFDIIFKIVM